MDATDPTGVVGASCALVHECTSAPVFCAGGVHQNVQHTLERSSRAVAAAVLASQSPNHDQIRDEYIVCRRPDHCRCTAAKSALRCPVECDDPPQSCNRERAQGITLMEWTRQNVRVTRDAATCHFDTIRRRMLCRAVRLARAVAGALAEAHEAGIVHQNFGVESLIVYAHTCLEVVNQDESDRQLDEFSINIIGLKSEVVRHDRDSLAFVRAKQHDLASLGAIFGSMFWALCCPFISRGEGDTDESLRNGFTLSTLHEVRETGKCTVGIPMAIWTLILTLEMSGNETNVTDCSYQYHSARDVQIDLSQILNYPERFLFESNSRKVTPGELEFPCDRLYGRQREMAGVTEAYSRVACAAGAGRSEILLVSGTSGSGKSSLVRQFRHLLNDEKATSKFVGGKFDSLHHVEPLSAIRAAFTDYFDRLSENCSAGDLCCVGSAITERVGLDGMSALVDLIPSLGQFNGEERPPIATETATLNGTGARERLKYVFRSMVGAISNHSSPLVLFFDDLHWADDVSMDIIEAVVTDRMNTSLLFIGCYRDDEVDAAHPLSVRVREIEKLGIPITNIEVGGISEDSMNHMISDAMHALRSSTRSLTDIVHHQTGGNTLFAIQYLKSLRDEGLLISSSLVCWQWNVETIRSRNITATSLQLITERILSLPLDVIGALEVAACLGARCDEATLHLISDEDEQVERDPEERVCSSDTVSGPKYLASMLNIAVYQGLVKKEHSRYEFVHDLIQYAVYRLIPESKKGPLHLRIGKRVWQGSKSARLKEENIFLSVDQIFLASTFVDLGQDVNIAKLFLHAGKKAMSLTFFSSAATYFKAAFDLLGSGHWDDHYSLSLGIYESLAETEYCNGNFEEMGELIDEILARAKCFDDKLAAYSTLVQALGAKGDIWRAVEIGLGVLEELGEVFPASDESLTLGLRALYETRDLLDEFSDETLVTTMKTMEDERKMTVMHFLKHIVIYTNIESNLDLNVLVVLRMTQVTLRYGACEESAFALACYGAILCQVGRSKQGYKFGQYALEMLDRFKKQICIPGVYASVYTKVFFWGEHLKLSLQPLFRSYEIGMALGEVQLAMINARTFCQWSFCCGKHLDVLDREIGMFCEVMILHKQERLLTMMLILRQTVQNLMGCSVDPVTLSGEAMNQDQVLDSVSGKTRNVLWFVHYNRMLLACIFGDYRVADECAGVNRFSEKSAGFCTCSNVFLDGLTALVLARKTKCTLRRKVASAALQKLKTWAEIVPCNFQHMVFLLEAERAFLLDDEYNAEKMYDAAIASAGENGFTPHQALACERAAAFHLEHGDEAKASRFYDTACDLYFKWGAQGKVDQLRKDALSLCALGT